jgi:hypothetical protein
VDLTRASASSRLDYGGWNTRQERILAHACASVAWPIAKVPHDGDNNDGGLGRVAMAP